MPLDPNGINFYFSESQPFKIQDNNKLKMTLVLYYNNLMPDLLIWSYIGNTFHFSVCNC